MFEVFKSPTIKEDVAKNQIIVEGINLKLVYRDFEKYIGSKMLYNILDKSSRYLLSVIVLENDGYYYGYKYHGDVRY